MGKYSKPGSKKVNLASLKDSIEKALETNLTNEQKALFERYVVTQYKGGQDSRTGIKAFEKMFNEIRREIAFLPKEKQSFAWQEFGRQLYIYAQTEGKNDALGELIISLYDAKRNILVKGNPPLSQQTAESYVEMSTFVYEIVDNRKVFLTTKQKQELINDLSKNFPSYSRENQEQISQANALWGQLRYNWEHASKEEQENFRKELSQHVAEQTQNKEIKSEPFATISSTTNELENHQNQSSADGQKDVQTIRTIHPKFLETVKNLREKATKISLFPKK